jgi:rhamnose utilization protein RhaD (predicted bifunctional aldolase and dehydrogenase)
MKKKGGKMKNKATQKKVMKRRLSKCVGIFRAYTDLQDKFADYLEKDENIKEFRCNVDLEQLSLEGQYTTDFLCTLNNGELAVWECVSSKRLTKPLTCKMLDESRGYWTRRGVKWGIVIDAKK